MTACRRLGEPVQRLALVVDRLSLHGAGPQDLRVIRLPVTDALHALDDDYAQATGAAPDVRIRGSVERVGDDVVAAVR